MAPLGRTVPLGIPLGRTVPLGKTYFAIKGNISINKITEILKLKNTSGHSIGDKKKYGKGLYDWASWEYGVNCIETLDVGKQAEEIVNVLYTKINELLYISNTFECNFILEQVPVINNGDIPSLGYTKKVIDFCSKTNTIIDVDLYVNP